MPTEHEFKYALSLDFTKDYPHERLMNELDAQHLHIRQGYLAFSKGMSLRIRSLAKGGKEQWFLTFKQKVADRVIELEKKLRKSDSRDGEQLWEIAVGQLKKDRYVIKCGGYKWEVDLFHKGGHLYFVQVEIELPEGSPRPTELPDFMRRYVLYEVPLTDDRFSNKRLGDVEYAHRLYQELTEKRNVSEDLRCDL